MRIILALGFIGISHCSFAQSSLASLIAKKAAEMEQKVIEWRRDIHQNPELGNREFKTAAKVAAHLKMLGLEVKENIAHTGVVGILRGGKPGPVVLLRADMDALPVTERTDIPFKSVVTTLYKGQQTGVMHACGHDAHTAILMGVATVLTSLKKDLAGTVKFVFQPAEEGAPPGEGSGAYLMIQEGVMENPKVDVAMGLHMRASTEAGTIQYRSGATMAAVNSFSINVMGKQTHGANPWAGIDPIVTAAQIVMGLQTIVSRNMNLTEDPAIVSIGAINGGNRENIIPEEVKMIGTVRTFSNAQRDKVFKRMEEIIVNIAQSAGAKATLKMEEGCPVTYNDPALTEKMIPVLNQLAGKENIQSMLVETGSEDFSFFGEKVPSFFFFLGGRKKGVSSQDAAPHHTPDFYLDESGFLLCVKALSNLAVSYMDSHPSKSGTQ